MKTLNSQITKRTSLDMYQAQVIVKSALKMQNLQILSEHDRAEVLEFLSIRPVHTVVMSSFIQDNGVVSADNRGKFYGYRNADGELEGVSLIGHTTLIESRTVAALTAFAHIARESETPIHTLMSDGTTTETFWNLYARESRAPRLICTELLFELSFPFQVKTCEWEVRLAKTEELEKIAAAHAEVAFIESGVDPKTKDPEGFRKRCLRRIEKERTFVVYDNENLVFKADIVAETNDVIYLEGVYISADYRGRGVGVSCLSALSLSLLDRVEHICLLSNIEFKNAHKSFAKAGFRNTDRSQIIFV